MVLAVSEAAGNSVEHAYLETASDTVELIFWGRTGRGVRRGPRPRRVADGAEEHRERSRGILVMRGLMESVHIDYGPAGTSVLLRLAMHDGVLDRAR